MTMKGDVRFFKIGRRVTIGTGLNESCARDCDPYCFLFFLQRAFLAVSVENLAFKKQLKQMDPINQIQSLVYI